MDPIAIRDSLSEPLLANGVNIDINDYDQDLAINNRVSKAQKNRLRALFNICDSNHDGVLNKDEIRLMFAKLHRTAPDAKILQDLRTYTKDTNEITWEQFMLIFADAKEEQIRHTKMSGYEPGPLEVFGNYILKRFSKIYTVGMLKREMELSKQRVEKRLEKIQQKNSRLVGTSDWVVGVSPSKMLFPEDDPSKIYMMGKREKQEMEFTKWLYIFGSGLTGAFFSSMCALLQIYISGVWGYDGEIPATHYDWWTVVRYWAIFVGATIISCIFEALILYYGALHSSAKISFLLGVEAWLISYVSDSEHAATAIARAAMDMPHPSQIIMGIRPLKEANRFNIYIKGLFWKAKTAMTAFVIKQILKNVLTKAAARVALPFISVPVCFFWNCLVAWKVLHDVVSISIGNAIMPQLITKFVKLGRLSPEAREALYFVPGCAMVMVKEVHPNLETLLKILVTKLGPLPSAISPDDKKEFKEKLQALSSREEKLIILQLFTMAILTNSSVGYSSLKFLTELTTSLGFNPDQRGVEEIFQSLQSRSIFVADISRLFRAPLETDLEIPFGAKVRRVGRIVLYNVAF